MSSSRPRTARGAWFRPILVVLVALGAGMLLVAPMVTMEPEDLPIGVLNLDEGFEHPRGTVEAGDEAVESLTADDSDGTVSWHTLHSEEVLDHALEENELYAALVVPADFSESQVMAQQGAGEASAMTLIVNEGKHPMVTGQMSGMFDDLTSGSDATIETERYNTIPDELGPAATVLPMMFMILVYIAAYAGGIVTRSTFPLDGMGTARRAGRAAIQLGIAAVASVITGAVAAWAMGAFAPDAEFSTGGAVLFLSVAAFALMTLVIGAINWLGTAGMLVPVAILLLGMGAANLPYEFLPSFWQDWVHPWNPLRFLADGARALLFQGAGWWNAATPGLIATGAVGTVAVAASVFTPRGKPDRPSGTAQEATPEAAPAAA